MVRIDWQEAQADPARFLERVAAGESILLVREHRPLAEIRPSEATSTDLTPRPLGLAKGTFEVPASFFDPLPDDLLALFNGEGP